MTIPSRSVELFDRLLAHNPFTDNRVNAPSDDDVDLAELNRVAFERLTGLAREALEQRRGIGAMLWGEAGVGKSHLLSRLDRWARTDGRACSIYLHNLLASPANLPRVLLRNVVGKLTWTDRSSFSGTVLFQLLSTAIGRALGDVNGFRSWSLLRQTLLDVLVGAAPEGPADAGLADPTVVDVLFRFYRSVLRRRQGKEDGTTAALAVQWLRGDTIPAYPAHELLGLPPGNDPDGPVQIEDAQQIKQVLVALSRLTAACEQPFILAFDQVDNLEDQQASALVRFLEAVIDSSRNLLAVTAGIQPSLVRWHDHGVIQHSAWDRLAQIQLQLPSLTPGQARQLLEVRLRHFFEPFEEVAEVRQLFFDDSLFPLGTRWFEQHMGQSLDIRPREILNAAREAWHREQSWLRQSGGPRWLAEWKTRHESEDGILPPVNLTEFDLNELIDRAIDKHMTEHATNLRGIPPERESLAEGLTQLLEENRKLDPSSPLLRVLRPEEGGTPYASAYHLFLDHRAGAGNEIRTGVVLVHDASSRSTYNTLSKLNEDLEPPGRLLLVANETGVQVGDKGQERLDALFARSNCSVEILKVPAVELVTLDALNATWNLARSEDLDVSLPDGRTRGVTPDEVIGSHSRKGRFAQSSVLRAALASPTLSNAAPAPVAEPQPSLAATLAVGALAVGAIGVAALAVSHAMPVAEPMLAEPSFDDLFVSEPPVAMPIMATAAPAMAIPVEEATPAQALPWEMDEETAAILFEEEPAVAMPVVEDAAAILLTEDFEAAEVAAVIEEDASAAILLTVEEEDEAGTILLGDAEEEEEAIVMDLDEEDAEAILLVDETQEGVIELSDEEATAMLLDDEEPKLEL